MERLRVSERRACRVLGQARNTQRRRPKVRGDEDALTGRIIELATCYGRYGYRRIAALLENLFGSKIRAKALAWLVSHPDERYFVRQIAGIL